MLHDFWLKHTYTQIHPQKERKEKKMLTPESQVLSLLKHDILNSPKDHKIITYQNIL